jgi:hypothetical protein
MGCFAYNPRSVVFLSQVEIHAKARAIIECSETGQHIPRESAMDLQLKELFETPLNEPGSHSPERFSKAL